MLGNFAHQIQSLLLAYRQLTFPSICTLPSFSVYVQQKKIAAFVLAILFRLYRSAAMLTLWVDLQSPFTDQFVRS
jgi:hypothetical protein